MVKLFVYLRKLRAKLSASITGLEKGIRPLVPVTDDLEGQIEHLRKAGLINWDGKKLGPSSSPLVNTGDRLASDLLLEMRD